MVTAIVFALVLIAAAASSPLVPMLEMSYDWRSLVVRVAALLFIAGVVGALAERERQRAVSVAVPRRMPSRDARLEHSW